VGDTKELGVDGDEYVYAPAAPTPQLV